MEANKGPVSTIAKPLPILFKDFLCSTGDIGATTSTDAGPGYLARLLRAAEVCLQRFADHRRNRDITTASLLLETHIEVIGHDKCYALHT